jgi:hypothetical protein
MAGPEEDGQEDAAEEEGEPAHQQGVGRLPVLGGEAPARPGIVRALLGAGEPQGVWCASG